MCLGVSWGHDFLSGSLGALCFSDTMHRAAFFCHTLLPWCFWLGTSQPWNESFETMRRHKPFLHLVMYIRFYCLSQRKLFIEWPDWVIFFSESPIWDVHMNSMYGRAKDSLNPKSRYHICCLTYQGVSYKEGMWLESSFSHSAPEDLSK